MRFGALAGVMVAVLAVAQPGSAGVTPISKVAVTASGCPGALRADQHTVGGQRALWTTSLEDKDRKGTWWPIMGTLGVHVVFQGKETRPRSLEFSVSYLPTGAREVSGAEPKGAQEMKKSYTLTGNDKARLEADLLVGPASTVTRVRLVSATFTDGRVWHATSEGACSLEPNRVLAVEGKESSLEW